MLSKFGFKHSRKKFYVVNIKSFCSAIDILKKKIEFAQIQNGAIDEKVLSLKHELGITYRNQGNFREAETEFKNILDSFKEFGKFNATYAVSVINIGITYALENRIEEGVNLMQEGLECLKHFKDIDENKTFYMESMNYLGILHHKLGKLDAAIIVYEDATSLMIQTLGEYNEITLNAVGQKGILYSELGNIINAERDLTLALSGLRLICNDNNTLTISQNSMLFTLELAKVYNRSLAFQKAEEILLNALHFYYQYNGKTYVPSSYLTLLLAEINLCYVKQSKASQLQSLYDEIYHKLTETIIYLENKLYQEYESVESKDDKIRYEMFICIKANVMWRCKVLMNLCNISFLESNYERCESLLVREINDIRERESDISNVIYQNALDGVDTDGTGRSNQNNAVVDSYGYYDGKMSHLLALVYDSMSQQEHARVCYEQAVAKFRHAHSESDEQFVRPVLEELTLTLKNYGQHLEKCGVFKECSSVYLEVLGKFVDLFGVNHKETESLLDLCVTFAVKIQDVHMADGERLLLQCLNCYLLKKSMLDEMYKSDSDIGTQIVQLNKTIGLLSINIGNLCRVQQKHEDALALLKRGIEFSMESHSEDSDVIIHAMGNLSKVYGALNNFSDSEKLLRKILGIKQSRYGDLAQEILLDKYSLGVCLSMQNKHQESEIQLRDAVQGMRKHQGNTNEITLNAIASLGVTLLNQNKLLNAEILFREAYLGLIKIKGRDCPQVNMLQQYIDHVMTKKAFP